MTGMSVGFAIAVGTMALQTMMLLVASELGLDL